MAQQQLEEGNISLIGWRMMMPTMPDSSDWTIIMA